MTRNGKLEEKERANQKHRGSNLPRRLLVVVRKSQLSAVTAQQLAERSITGANVYAPMYEEEIRVEVKK